MNLIDWLFIDSERVQLQQALAKALQQNNELLDQIRRNGLPPGRARYRGPEACRKGPESQTNGATRELRPVHHHSRPHPFDCRMDACHSFQPIDIT
jgi:hypothetical protein